MQLPSPHGLKTLNHVAQKARPLRFRKVLLLPLAGTLLASVVLAFTVISGSTLVKVGEPLSLVSASVTNGSCTNTSTTWSCSTTMFAGDVGTINLTVMNRAQHALTLTMITVSNSTDITVESPLTVTAVNGQTVIVVGYSVSQSSAVNETAVLTGTIDR